MDHLFILYAHGLLQGLLHHLVSGVIESNTHSHIVMFRHASQLKSGVRDIERQLHDTSLHTLHRCAGDNRFHRMLPAFVTVEKRDALARLELTVRADGKTGSIFHFQDILVQGIVESLAQTHWKPATAVEMAVLQRGLEGVFQVLLVVCFLQGDQPQLFLQGFNGFHQ